MSTLLDPDDFNPLRTLERGSPAFNYEYERQLAIYENISQPYRSHIELLCSEVTITVRKEVPLALLGSLEGVDIKIVLPAPAQRLFEIYQEVLGFLRSRHHPERFLRYPT